MAETNRAVIGQTQEDEVTDPGQGIKSAAFSGTWKSQQSSESQITKMTVLPSDRDVGTTDRKMCHGKVAHCAHRGNGQIMLSTHSAHGNCRTPRARHMQSIQ